MISIKSSVTATALNRAREIIADFPGSLRQVLEGKTQDKIRDKVLPQLQNPAPERGNTPFKFGSDKSRRTYMWLARTKQISAQLVDGVPVYQRTGRLTSAWKVKIDARRSKVGGFISIDNRAADEPGRVYPQFVYGPTSASSPYRQQPGHIAWRFNKRGIERQLRRIVSNDINDHWRRQNRGLR